MSTLPSEEKIKAAASHTSYATYKIDVSYGDMEQARTILRDPKWVVDEQNNRACLSLDYTPKKEVRAGVNQILASIMPEGQIGEPLPLAITKRLGKIYEPEHTHSTLECPADVLKSAQAILRGERTLSQ